MRELKFRVWNSVENKWNGLHHNSPRMIGELCCLNGVYLIPESVSRKLVLQQFTGLKDKNGKEICEGDIVKGLFFDTDVMADLVTICPVVWVEDRACFNIGHRYWTKSATTVIGNIFENPELLQA